MRNVAKPMVGDRLSRLTFASIGFSLAIPVLYVSFSSAFGSMLPASAMNVLSWVSTALMMVAQSIASFGVIWAVIGTLRWLATAPFGSMKPLGHSLMICLAGFIGLWFTPAVILLLPLTPEKQVAATMLAVTVTALIAQVSARLWPNIEFKKSAGSAK